MSEPEKFLSRWSRRKQEAERTGDAPDDAPPEQTLPPPEAAPARPGTSNPPQAGAVDKPEPEFDVSTLPPIDSIGVGTDIRSFLQKGVPLELTRAALRRAWVTDPAIRDFIEVAENQWDFATGSDVPGFGPLQSNDDIRRLVAEILHRTTDAPLDGREQSGNAAAQTAQNQSDLPHESQGPDRNAESASQPEALAGTFTEATPNAIVQREESFAVRQAQEKSESRQHVKRGRGRALPQ